MRRVTLGAMALVLAFAPAACKRKPPRVDVIENENRAPLSSFAMSDPRGAAQLLSGFHNIENNAWRWTMRKFAVILLPPPGAPEKGARLRLELVVPDVVISRRRPLTLSAAAEGVALPPETYTQAGPYTYSRDVPPGVFAAAAVKIDFSLDKYLASGEIEARELGIIVKSIALDTK